MVGTLDIPIVTAPMGQKTKVFSENNIINIYMCVYVCICRSEKMKPKYKNLSPNRINTPCRETEREQSSILNI
jgi:hypothetical protein